MENANNSWIESHRSSTILSQSDGTHCDTPNAILDVPHPLQRQRYHLLDRDPQWHNVFLSANSHQSSMATKGSAQENSIFTKEQGHHAPAELLVEPPRSWSSPTQGHLSMVQWSLSHSEIYQPILSIVINSHHTCH